MKTLGRTLIGIATAVASTGAAVAEPSIYIPLGAAGKVQVVDVNSRKVIGTIDEVGNAHGLAITPDGHYLVAGSFDEGARSAAGTPPRPATVSEAEHAKHHAKPAASTTVTAGTSYVSIIDATARKVVRRVAVQGAVHHVEISPDGKFAVATHPGRGMISAIDLERFELAFFAPNDG